MLSFAGNDDIQIVVSAGCSFFSFVVGFKLYLPVNMLPLLMHEEVLCRSHPEFTILACSMALDLLELNQRWYVFSTKMLGLLYKLYIKMFNTIYFSYLKLKLLKLLISNCCLILDK